MATTAAPKINHNLTKDGVQFLKRLTGDMVLADDVKSMPLLIKRLLKDSNKDGIIDEAERKEAAEELIKSLKELDRNKDSRNSEQQDKWAETEGFIRQKFKGPSGKEDDVANGIAAKFKDPDEVKKFWLLLGESGSDMAVTYTQAQLQLLKRMLNGIAPGLGDVVARVIDSFTGGQSGKTENELMVQDRLEQMYDGMHFGPAALAKFHGVEPNLDADGKSLPFKNMPQALNYKQWDQFFGEGMKDENRLRRIDENEFLKDRREFIKGEDGNKVPNPDYDKVRLDEGGKKNPHYNPADPKKAISPEGLRSGQKGLGGKPTMQWNFEPGTEKPMHYTLEGKLDGEDFRQEYKSISFKSMYLDPLMKEEGIKLTQEQEVQAIAYAKQLMIGANRLGNSTNPDDNSFTDTLEKENIIKFDDVNHPNARTDFIKAMEGVNPRLMDEDRIADAVIAYVEKNNGVYFPSVHEGSMKAAGVDAKVIAGGVEYEAETLLKALESKGNVASYNEVKNAIWDVADHYVPVSGRREFAEKYREYLEDKGIKLKHNNALGARVGGPSAAAGGSGAGYDEEQATNYAKAAAKIPNGELAAKQKEAAGQENVAKPNTSPAPGTGLIEQQPVVP